MEKRLWMICTTHMLLEIYLLIQVAIIPVLIKEFQLSLLEASLVATIPSFVQLLMNIPTGFFTERFSPNKLLFVSMLIEGLSALLVSQTNTFWLLVVGVSLLKISSPLYHISGLSQISRLAKSNQVSRSMGFHNAFGSLGSALGLVSLAVFLSTLGWRWTYLVWSFPILVWGFIVLTSSQLKTKGSERNGVESKVGLRRFSFVLSSGLLIFLIAVAVREVGSTGSSTFMTTYFVETRGLSDSMASLIFGLGPFTGVVGSLTGGYIGERVGARKALSWIIIGSAISLFMLSIVSHLYLLILVYGIYAFFSNAVWSPMNVLVADFSPVGERGLGFSLYFLTEGMVASVAPTLAASVIIFSDVWFVFPFSIFFLLSGLMILQRFRRLESQ
jgi:MFS family permease